MGVEQKVSCKGGTVTVKHDKGKRSKRKQIKIRHNKIEYIERTNIGQPWQMSIMFDPNRRNPLAMSEGRVISGHTHILTRDFKFFHG